MPNSAILLIMTLLFLALGYLGVPVAFSLMAGVIVGTMLTPISLQSIVGQAFNGVDSEALMAIPFFLLVGELMTSANVIIRIAELSQALVGHIRGAGCNDLEVVGCGLSRLDRLSRGRSSSGR